MLIQRTKAKGNVTSNYHPKPRLHLAWKLLTGMIADEIYGFLDNEKVLSEEQKGC